MEHDALLSGLVNADGGMSHGILLCEKFVNRHALVPIVF